MAVNKMMNSVSVENMMLIAHGGVNVYSYCKYNLLKPGKECL